MMHLSRRGAVSDSLITDQVHLSSLIIKTNLPWRPRVAHVRPWMYWDKAQFGGARAKRGTEWPLMRDAPWPNGPVEERRICMGAARASLPSVDAKVVEARKATECLTCSITFYHSVVMSSPSLKQGWTINNILDVRKTCLLKSLTGMPV